MGGCVRGCWCFRGVIFSDACTIDVRLRVGTDAETVHTLHIAAPLPRAPPPAAKAPKVPKAATSAAAAVVVHRKRRLIDDDADDAEGSDLVSHAAAPPVVAAAAAAWSTSSGPKGTKAKKPKVEKDPNAPKVNVSAYAFYVAQTRGAVMKDHPEMGFKDVAALVGQSWKALTPEQQQPFVAMAIADRERYDREKQAAGTSAGGGAVTAAAATLPSTEDEESDQAD